jgi:hypothetical protein
VHGQGSRTFVRQTCEVALIEHTCLPTQLQERVQRRGHDAIGHVGLRRTCGRGDVLLCACAYKVCGVGVRAWAYVCVGECQACAHGWRYTYIFVPTTLVTTSCRLYGMASSALHWLPTVHCACTQVRHAAAAMTTPHASLSTAMASRRPSYGVQRLTCVLSTSGQSFDRVHDRVARCHVWGFMGALGARRRAVSLGSGGTRVCFTHTSVWEHVSNTPPTHSLHACTGRRSTARRCGA